MAKFITRSIPVKTLYRVCVLFRQDVENDKWRCYPQDRALSKEEAKIHYKNYLTRIKEDMNNKAKYNYDNMCGFGVQWERIPYKENPCAIVGVKIQRYFISAHTTVNQRVFK